MLRTNLGCRYRLQIDIWLDQTQLRWYIESEVKEIWNTSLGLEFSGERVTISICKSARVGVLRPQVRTLEMLGALPQLGMLSHNLPLIPDPRVI